SADDRARRSNRQSTGHFDGRDRPCRTARGMYGRKEQPALSERVADWRADRHAIGGKPGTERAMMTRRLSPEPSRAGERGFIIVAVLWILAGLAALAAVYSIYVANAAISISVLTDEVQVEALVSASLELTAYQLLASKREERPTRGQFVFGLGRANVSVEF